MADLTYPCVRISLAVGSNFYAIVARSAIWLAPPEAGQRNCIYDDCSTWEDYTYILERAQEVATILKIPLYVDQNVNERLALWKEHPHVSHKPAAESD